MAKDKPRIWGGWKHDAKGKRTTKVGSGGGGLTASEKDRKTAQGLAKAQAKPYRTAADEVQADIDRGMSDADIAKKYSAGYAAAGDSAAAYAPAITASSGNVAGLISGLAGVLPGGTTDYGVTSMLAGVKDEAASNSFLAGLFGQSAGIDVGSAAAAGISGAQGRAADRVDALSKEKRGLVMQGDVVAGDYLSQMNNLLGIRSSRQNLALEKLKIAAAKQALEDARKAGKGSGSSVVAPVVDTKPKPVKKPGKSVFDYTGIPQPASVVQSGVMGSPGSWMSQYGVNTG